MRWVALDRAIDLAGRLGDDMDVDTWRRARDELRADILDHAWDPKIGAFTGAYGSDQLDASVLLLPMVGFLPASEPRMHATIDAIDHQGAHRQFQALAELANDVGLLAEMADPTTGELIGNIPQAFSHVGLINTAWRLSQASETEAVRA